MKMLHFPKHSGLKSRPFDAYDHTCARYYDACQSGNGSLRRETEAVLRSAYSSDDLDMDYTHGRNIRRRYRVTA